MESVFYELNEITMDINEMIEKWEKKHSSLLDEYNRTRGMMTEREIVECIDHRKNVLRFVEDLRQVKNCSIPDVVESGEQFYCADWDRCGSVCEEQCNACIKADNMPEVAQ
jgi:hypothetical protein